MNQGANQCSNAIRGYFDKQQMQDCFARFNTMNDFNYTIRSSEGRLYIGILIPSHNFYVVK